MKVTKRNNDSALNPAATSEIRKDRELALQINMNRSTACTGVSAIGVDTTQHQWLKRALGAFLEWKRGADHLEIFRDEARAHRLAGGRRLGQRRQRDVRPSTESAAAGSGRPVDRTERCQKRRTIARRSKAG
jgi:hypothetical protein